ncbi:MAG: hypothetical protein ACOX3A_03285 [bacterium]
MTALIGCYCLASTLQGYMHTRLLAWQRVLLAGAALVLIQPGWQTDIIGIIILITVYYLQKQQLKRETLGRVTAIT